MIFPSKPPEGIVRSRNWHFQHLAEHLRPDEIDQWKAVTGAIEYNPDVAAGSFIASAGLKFTLLDGEGLPVCAGCFQDMGFGVWEGWMACTSEGWATHWRAMTKAARWYMGQLFERQAARRLYVATLAARTGATNWYQRSLGMRLDGVLRAGGAHGEDMVIYSRLSGD